MQPILASTEKGPISKMKRSQLQALSGVFSTGVLSSIMATGQSRKLAELMSLWGLVPDFDIEQSLADFFDRVFDILSRDYRIEYVYKNAIITKIVLGRHSLNSAKPLTEFRVGSCKADVVILNGTSTAYEIKTDFDRLDRVIDQMTEYSCVFDRVYLVTGTKYLKQALLIAPIGVGVIELTNRFTLKVCRVAQSNRANVRPQVLFDSLRKDEYTSVIRRAYGYVPVVPNTRMYNACKGLFCQLDPIVCHDFSIEALREFRCPSVNDTEISSIPYSLRGLVLGASGLAKKLPELSQLLTTRSLASSAGLG